MNKFLAVLTYHLYRPRTLFKRYCTESSTEECEVKEDVPGLSSNVVHIPSGDVGPGASKSKEYKNPEYFCYDKMSYFEAEIEMLNYRLPQPSSINK